MNHKMTLKQLSLHWKNSVFSLFGVTFWQLLQYFGQTLTYQTLFPLILFYFLHMYAINDKRLKCQCSPTKNYYHLFIISLHKGIKLSLLWLHRVFLKVQFLAHYCWSFILCMYVCMYTGYYVQMKTSLRESLLWFTVRTFWFMFWFWFTFTQKHCILIISFRLMNSNIVFTWTLKKKCFDVYIYVTSFKSHLIFWHVHTGQIYSVFTDSRCT